MTESIEAPRGTVFVGRKISDQKFGSYDFGLHLPVPFDPAVPVAEQGELVTAFFALATELIGEQTKPLLALITERAFTAPAASGSAPAGNYSTDLRDGQVIKTCKVHGDVPHWDNRESKKSERAPDFKCSVGGEGIWLTPFKK